MGEAKAPFGTKDLFQPNGRWLLAFRNQLAEFLARTH
jgi:hypothetical protein